MLIHEVLALSHESPSPIDGQRLENIRAAQEARQPGRRARLLSRVRATRLDRELTADADPSASDELCARAMRLASPSGRLALADGLDRVLGSAGTPPAGGRVALRSAAVLANAATIEELAAMLRTGTPVYARGLARLSRLLSDGTGPVYNHDSDSGLSDELQRVRAAFAGDEG